MTTLDTNTALTKFRIATQHLLDIVQTYPTLPTYLQKVVQELVAEFGSLSRYSITPANSVTVPKLGMSSLSNLETAKYYGILPFGKPDERIVVEFALDTEEFWGLLLIWREMVWQVWQAHLTDEQIESQLRLFYSMSNIVRQIKDELVIGHVMNDACRSVVEALEAVDHVGIVLNTHAPEYGTVVAEYPNTGSIGVQLKLTGYRVLEQLQRTLQPVVINDITTSKALLGENYDTISQVGIKSMLILPLVVENQLIGSIGVDALKKSHTFSRAEIEIMQTLAAQIAIGIHNAEMVETISAKMVSDAITTEFTQRLPLRADLVTLLETSARELGVIVGAKRVKIHLNPEYLAEDEEIL